MKDKYLINRFITVWFYRQRLIFEDDRSPYIYKDDIDELLGKGLDCLNHMAEDELKQVKTLVLTTLEKSYYYLGGDAFRLMKDGRRTPINMNVFETTMYALMYIPEKNPLIKGAVKEKMVTFFEMPKFRENIGNHRDSAAKLKWRLDQAEKIGKAFK